MHCLCELGKRFAISASLWLTLASIGIYAADLSIPDSEIPAEELGQWLRDGKFDDSHARITLLGFHPALDPARGIQLKLTEMDAGSAVDKNHNALVSWIFSVLPKAKIECIDLPSEPNGEQVVRAIMRGLEENPAVLYVPAAMLPATPSEQAKLQPAIQEAWRKRVLMFTVVHNAENRWIPAGLLAIYLTDPAASNASSGNIEHKRPGVSLSLASLAKGTGSFTELPPIPLAASYFAIVAAALPVTNGPAHLERTARLCLTEDFEKSVPTGAAGNVLDVRRAFEPEAIDYSFAGRTFHWSDQVGGVGLVNSSPAATPKSGAVIAGISKSAQLRWLPAASILADAKLIYFLAHSSQGVCTVAPRQSSDDGATDTLEKLLSTQERTGDGDGLFNAVTQDRVRFANPK